MFEVFTIYEGRTTKGEFMRVSCLVIELSVAADTNLDSSDLEEAVCYMVSDHLIVIYPDTVVYRRLIALKLGRIFEYADIGGDSFDVVERFVLASGRTTTAVSNTDGDLRGIIKKQISWAVLNPAKRDIEIEQIINVVPKERVS